MCVAEVLARTETVVVKQICIKCSESCVAKAWPQQDTVSQSCKLKGSKEASLDG